MKNESIPNQSFTFYRRDVTGIYKPLRRVPTSQVINARLNIWKLECAMAFFKVYYDEENECLIGSLEGKASLEAVKKYAEKILETE